MGGDDHFQLTLRAANLVPVSRGFFGAGRTNPMFKLSAFQMGQAEPFYVVYESETVENNLSPTWRKSSTSHALFGDDDLPLMISVFDKQADKETPMGTVETSIKEILRRVVGDTDQVDSSKVFKLKDAAGKEAGFIVVVAATIGPPDLDEPESPPESNPEPRESTKSLTSPQSTHSLDSTDDRDSIQSNNNGSNNNNNNNMLLEMAKLQQASKDMTRRMEKLETETSDLRHENRDLKDRVKYLEISLKQDRKLMDAAQKEIADLKTKQLISNGSSHHTPLRLAPNPSVLDGELLTTPAPTSTGSSKEMDSSRSRKEKEMDASRSRDRDRDRDRDKSPKNSHSPHHPSAAKRSSGGVGGGGSSSKDKTTPTFKSMAKVVSTANTSTSRSSRDRGDHSTRNKSSTTLTDDDSDRRSKDGSGGGGSTPRRGSMDSKGTAASSRSGRDVKPSSRSAIKRAVSTDASTKPESSSRRHAPRRPEKDKDKEKEMNSHSEKHRSTRR